jgi:hypothetical protein
MMGKGCAARSFGGSAVEQANRQHADKNPLASNAMETL